MGRVETAPNLIPHLEALRDELGLTNDQFARSMGINPGRWSRMRAGLERMSDRNLMRVLRKRRELLPLVFPEPTADRAA